MTSRLQADQACKKISSAFIKACLVFLRHLILTSYDKYVLTTSFIITRGVFCY